MRGYINSALLLSIPRWLVIDTWQCVFRQLPAPGPSVYTVGSGTDWRCHQVSANNANCLKNEWNYEESKGSARHKRHTGTLSNGRVALRLRWLVGTVNRECKCTTAKSWGALLLSNLTSHSGELALLLPCKQKHCWGAIKILVLFEGIWYNIRAIVVADNSEKVVNCEEYKTMIMTGQMLNGKSGKTNW